MSAVADPRARVVGSQIAQQIQKNFGPATDLDQVAAQTPYWLSEQLTTTIREIAPIFQLLHGKEAKTAEFEYPYLKHRRPPGIDAGIETDPQARRAELGRRKSKLKLKKSAIEVWDFIENSTADIEQFNEAVFQLAQEQISYAEDLNFSLMFDNAGSNPLAWNGLFTMLRENRTDNADPTSGNPRVPELEDIKELIQVALLGGNEDRPLLWIMSGDMYWYLSSLWWDKVRYTQNVGPAADPNRSGESGSGKLITLDGGWTLNELMGYPVLRTPLVGGRTAGVMPAITTAVDAVGGVLGAGNYHFAVTKFSLKNDRDLANRAIGESAAAFTTGPVNIASGSTNQIRIQVPEDPYVLYYRVYYSPDGDPANFRPILHVPAQNRDSKGDFVSYVTELTVTTTLQTEANGIIDGIGGDRPPRRDGTYNPEFIALLDLDELNGMGQYLYFKQKHGDPLDNQSFSVIEQMGRQTDKLRFQLRTYGAPAPRSTASSAIMLNCRPERIKNPGT